MDIQGFATAVSVTGTPFRYERQRAPRPRSVSQPRQRTIFRRWGQP